MSDKILITAALPYANGPIHLGHLVEYVQTDIYVRFLRSTGADVVFLCADDTHGTPIELNAAKQGVKPEEFVASFHEAHQRDFAGFDVRFDAYGSTHSEENRAWATRIYERLKAEGDIARRPIEQTYCEKDGRFLPDRFVRGNCPNCKAPDQYGDVCEKCGKTYEPTELIEPRCALCGEPPVRRVSEHLFFKLPNHQAFLEELIADPAFLHAGLGTQLRSFFEKGLNDWDISRDGPYFGFEIPGETEKYFYVWLDAPIGYISTTERWAKAQAAEGGRQVEALDYWGGDSDARIVHFIGKDIVYFHALFWPAVLRRAGLKVPDKLVVHGHLTVDGQKMSKTRGTLVAASDYLERLDPSHLRFFYAANLGSGPEDFDLSLNDFRLRVNGELVNNLGNLAQRTLSLLAREALGGRLAPPSADGPGRARVEEALAKVPDIRAAYERLDYRGAVRLIVEIAQSGNQFLQEQAPWKTMKTDLEAARRDLSDAAELIYLATGLLAPVVPRVAERLFAQLGSAPLTFERLTGGSYPLLDRDAAHIAPPEPVLARIEAGVPEALVKPAGTPAG